MSKRSILVGALAALAIPAIARATGYTGESHPYTAQVVSFQAGQGGHYFVPVPTTPPAPYALTGNGQTRPIQLVPERIGAVQAQLLWVPQVDSSR